MLGQINLISYLVNTHTSVLNPKHLPIYKKKTADVKIGVMIFYTFSLNSYTKNIDSARSSLSSIDFTE